MFIILVLQVSGPQSRVNPKVHRESYYQMWFKQENLRYHVIKDTTIAMKSTVFNYTCVLKPH